MSKTTQIIKETQTIWRAKKPITEFEKGEMLGLHLAGVSAKKIAKKLKRSYSQTRNWLHNGKRQEDGRSNNSRPRKTTKKQDRYICYQVQGSFEKRSTPPKKIKENLKSVGIALSVTSIKRRLCDAGFNGRIARNKPLLRNYNIDKRLECAINHKDWTEQDWEKVLWTDESPYTLFPEKRRVYIRRRAGEELLPECVQSTVKHGGGKIQVWGCFSASGVGNFKRIEGIVHIIRSHVVHARQWPQAHCRQESGLHQQEIWPCSGLGRPIAWLESNWKSVARAWKSSPCAKTQTNEFGPVVRCIKGWVATSSGLSPKVSSFNAQALSGCYWQQRLLDWLLTSWIQNTKGVFQHHQYVKL